MRIVETAGIFHRLTLSILQAMGAGIITAIVIAVLDIYLTGHGYGSILQEIISWKPGNVHLSFGDLVVLLASALSGYITWHQSSRGA